jgi:hypothetical protein
MARATKTVSLKKPFDAGGVQVTQVVLQEPTAADYFALGAPQTWVRAAGGMALVDNDAAIRSYAERLIVQPDPLLAMNNMSVLDAIAVKDAIVSFFSDEASAS